MRLNTWSPEQEQFMRDNYRKMKVQDVVDQMPPPRKGYNAVVSKAAQMGLKDAKRSAERKADNCWHEVPVHRLLTSLFRDYATAPQRYVMAKREPESVGGAA